MAVLEIRNVSKIYRGGVKAVDRLDLQMDDGEFVILVGPSGCGKSTILRMLAGLEEITEGQFLMDGIVMNSIEPQKRELAMVFQSYALYPHLSAYENIAFPLQLRKVSRDVINQRVKEVARVLNLFDFLERMPRELSGGQRQRVALGRAMVREPKVFLFDEPLSNLDAKLRAEMRVEISELHSRLKANFVYVTHDQVEAMTLGQRIVVIKEGKLQQFASPEELFEYPANLFVAGFIGTPAMNFLNVKIEVEGDDYRLISDNFKIKLDPSYKPYLERTHSREVVMGIRPKDLYLEGSSNTRIIHPNNLIGGKFLLKEMLGDEVLYYFAIPSKTDSQQTLIVKEAQSVDFERDHFVKFYVDPVKIYLFDASSQFSMVEIKGQY